MSYRWKIWAALALSLALVAPTPALALTTITFETEDDGVTPLVNGQIVDPAFDGADPEFGVLFNLSTTFNGAGPGTHQGATIFDSDPSGPNSGSQDPDLLVNTGNILILQSNNPGSTTTLDPTYGLLYDFPNDEADLAQAGSFIFDFVNPVFLVSVDLIDANGGFLADIILTDGDGDSRTYTVPSMWTGDIDVCGGCNGFDTLDLTSLIGQLGEGGSTTSVSEIGTFTATDVIKLEIKFAGNPGSGGIDNLTLVPEPSTALLLSFGLTALAAARRRQRS